MAQEKEQAIQKRVAALNTARKTWRPFGFWALTFHVLAMPAGLIIFSAIRPEFSPSDFTGTYSSILAAWVASAGIRQWGKAQPDNQDDMGPPR